MNADILRVVMEANPWLRVPDRLAQQRARRLPKALIARQAAGPLRAQMADSRRAHLVVGPRQAGKSTLIWSLLSDVRHLLFLDCEEPLIQRWCRSPALFIADARELLPEGGVLFLDEAQRLEEAGLFVKGIIDAHTGWIVLVTGSASFHLLARTRESLAGRATRHFLWPLSLGEAAQTPADVMPAVRRWMLGQTLDRALIEGGYPGVWTHAEPQRALHHLIDAFVTRDASDRFRIERPDAFRLLLRLAAGQLGDLVRITEWAPILGITPPTVSDYLSILSETHITVTLRPFIGGRRAELTRAPKIYFIDNGLRNAISGGFEPLDRRPDVGKLLEGWVFSELHKRYPWPGDVRYWRSKNGAEVDFVLEPEPGRLLGLEVKARSGPRPKISRSAHSFIDAYAPAEFLLVYRGEPHEAQRGSTRVRWIPAELLAESLPGLERLG